MQNVASIAVARFESAQSHEQLGFGFAVLLTEHLRAVRDLRVVPARHALMDADRSAEEVGRRFGVDVVLTGSLHVHRDALEVTALLVDPLTEREVWTDGYAVQCDDALHVNRAIAERAAARVEHELHGQRVFSGAPAWDAFCAYAGGRYTDWFGGDEALVRAARLYERAAVLVPSFTPAVAAHAYAVMALIATGRADRARIDEMIAAATAALRRDRTSPDANAALGIAFLLRGDVRKSETYLRRADTEREREVFASALPALYTN